MKQIKIIFFDIDGTLIYNHGKITNKVMEAIYKVRDNGHYVFLCTGRNRIGVSELMDLNCFDYVYLTIDANYEDLMTQQAEKITSLKERRLP